MEIVDRGGIGIKSLVKIICADRGVVVEVADREVVDLEIREKGNYCNHNKGWIVKRTNSNIIHPIRSLHYPAPFSAN